MVSEEIQRLGKTCPSIVTSLITERDRYMVARLRECATILKPKCIVIAQRQRPELKHLSKLPESVEIVKISKSFADVGDEELRDVECMLVGAGPTGGTGSDAQEVFTRLPSSGGIGPVSWLW